MNNLIELVRKNLGFNELRKIDPNTQDVRDDEKIHGTDSLAQAAIPAVLIGLYNNLQIAESAAAILDGESVNWLKTIFGNRTDEVVDKIAAYAKTAPASVKQEAEHIANEAVRVVRHQIHHHNSFTAIRAFVKENRTDTLKYLPAALQIGDVVENNNIDDRTNKMEGPVSNFMHKVEKAFNSNE